MSRVKTSLMQQESLQDQGLNDLIRELREFHIEFSEDNEQAEERDRERARQYFSVWKV